MRALLALLTLVVGLTAAHAQSDGEQAVMREVIERQLDAFRRDDGAAAYAQAAPSIQRLFPNEERFMGMVREGYRPVYRPRSYSFGAFKETAAGPSQSVLVKDADGVDWVAVYTLERQPDGSWKISGCYLQKEPGEAV